MTDRKRIMMISTHGYVSGEVEFGKPDTGGQVVYVLELSKSLARLGYTVDILTRQFEDQPAEEKVTNRVRILRFPCGGEEFISKEYLYEHIPEWIENVHQWTKETGTEYAWIDSHYWDAGVAGQGLADILEIPHVHTPHSIGAWKKHNMEEDMDVSEEETEKKYNFRQRIRHEKAIYDECDALVATTPIQRRIVEGEPYDVQPDKVYVIPPGYDDRKFFPLSLAERQAIKQEHGYEGRLLLALGRMARNKGYDLLLKAMPFVFHRVPDAKLLLAPGSDDPDEDEIRQIEELKELARELGIEDRVIFVGFIADDDLPDHYRMADIFCLSSRYEPFGMTAVEAMACGTPTVITTEGGLWQQVRWGLEALYADPFDPEHFGHVLCLPLQLPKVADQLARYGPQKARRDFTWMGIAQRLLRVLSGYRMGGARGTGDLPEQQERSASPLSGESG